MAIAKKCDICGKLYETYNVCRNPNKPNGLQLLSIDDKREFYSYSLIDCCPECMESIKNHMESLKGDKSDDEN